MAAPGSAHRQTLLDRLFWSSDGVDVDPGSAPRRIRDGGRPSTSALARHQPQLQRADRDRRSVIDNVAVIHAAEWQSAADGDPDEPDRGCGRSPRRRPSTSPPTASDPEGQLARVEFFSGTTLLGTDTTAPYRVQRGRMWQPAPTAFARSRMTAPAPAASSATVSVTVQGANAPPSVTLTSPRVRGYVHGARDH